MTAHTEAKRYRLLSTSSGVLMAGEIAGAVWAAAM